jgi:hypothetical protein
MRRTAIWWLILALLPVPALADSHEEAETQEEGEEQEEERTKHPILFYLPNRIFDVLDVARARARIGPGVGVSARVTKPVSVTAGFYASVFVGLPGPRGGPKIPFPIGMENYAGADVSVMGVSTEGFGPNYGVGEIGAGVHAGVMGVDAGIDPVEILDLVLGFVFIDFMDDDF